MSFHVQRATDFHLIPNTEVGEMTTVDQVLSIYAEQLEKQYSLEEGAVKSTLMDPIPYFPLWEPTFENNVITPTTAVRSMTMKEAFGGDYGLLIVPTTEDDAFLNTHREVVRLRALNELLLGGDARPVSAKSKRTSQNQRVGHQTAKQQGAPTASTAPIHENLSNTALFEMIKQMEARREAETEALRAETQSLRAEAASWQKKTEQLEVTVKHVKGDLETTQRELEFVKESASDTTEWIIEGCPSDSVAFRRIKLRNLLDRVQAKLAYYASFTDALYARHASTIWRNRLEGLDTTARITSARSFLQHPDARGRNHSGLATFMASNEAMQIAVQLKSILREEGDQVAHSPLPENIFSEAVQGHVADGGKGGAGLNVFVEFLFSSH